MNGQGMKKLSDGCVSEGIFKDGNLYTGVKKDRNGKVVCNVQKGIEKPV